MFREKFFDNELVLKHFRKSHLDTMSDIIQLWLYNVSNRVANIINNDLAISCYGSDSRFDKLNNWESSIDLLICNNNSELLDEDIRDIIKEVVYKNKWVIEDNSYFEIWNNWEIYEIEDNIEIWKNIDSIQIDWEYIDVLHNQDELYKYKWKYFPDRLLDAYFIWWNKEILEKFKLQMLEDIILDNSIFKKFKKWIKNYFKQDYIKGKNHRNNLLASFNLDEKWWIIRFDNKNYYGFKHWPLRALQYKLVELFLKLIIEKKDKNIIKDFPFDISWRIEFLFNNWMIKLTKDESIQIVELYTYFKELNIKLERLFNYENYSVKNIFRTGIQWEFNIFWWENKEKIERFIELFNKI